MVPLPIKPTPSIAPLRIKPSLSGKKDEILILACDGVWDVVSNAEVHRHVY